MPPITLFCPVCQTTLSRHAYSAGSGADAETFECPRCGTFTLSERAVAYLEKGLKEQQKMGEWPHKRTVAALSYWIRRGQTSSSPRTYSSKAIERIIEAPTLPDLPEQIDNLVQWLGQELHEPGLQQFINPDGPIMAILGCMTSSAVLFVIKSAIELRLLEGAIGQMAQITLTLSGWQRYSDLKRGAATGQTAFMAMKFGDPELDALVDTHLRPAVDMTGFRLKRLDDEPRAGLIDDRLRVEIRACRFLIADLSHANKGAYWEAGYAEGLGKPVIYTCDKTVFEDPKNPDKPHFDTNHHLTIVWDKDRPLEAAENLKATIRATFPDARQQDPGEAL